MREIAIIGGGPAGAMCGQVLAAGGTRVTIYDEHLAWEKPCGGGLTHKAVVAYPFLAENPEPKKFVDCIELISSRDERVRFRLDHPIVIYSRAVLNGLLLKRAADAGCRIVRTRATRLNTDTPGVRLAAGASTHEADFAVIAAGARNALLPGNDSLRPADLEMTLGYFVPAQSDVVQVTRKSPVKAPGFSATSCRPRNGKPCAKGLWPGKIGRSWETRQRTSIP